MRKLASIQKVAAIEPIPGADRIEKLTILGWQLVSQKGNFAVGDPCVFFEPDSFMPVREEFEFLRKGCYRKLADGSEGFRLKTIRLRDVVSQGLALPPALFPELVGLEEGTDVTAMLGVTKFEPPIPACLAGDAKGFRPDFVPMTDEPRIQTDAVMPLLETFIGELFYVTQKIDGSSVSIYLNNGEFGVCSRTIDLKETPNNSQWKMARLMDIENKLRSTGRNIVLQGEIYGEGIQKNPEKILGQRIQFLNVLDCDKRRYMNFQEMKEFLAQLDLPMVPILSESTEMHADIPKWVEAAKIKSTINDQAWAEGIVVRPLKEGRFNGSRISFKVINPMFLLEEED